MHHLLQLAAFLAATLTCTTGSPLPQENALTPNPLNILHKREDSYDCSGSSNCIGVNVLRDCDDAVNGLSRGTDSKIYSASAHDGGQVVGQYGGCKIFLEKADDDQLGDCEGSGNDMWNGYQQIRRTGGCNVCGYKTFTNPEGSECRLKIDYVFCKPDAEDCGTEFGDRQWGKWT